MPYTSYEKHCYKYILSLAISQLTKFTCDNERVKCLIIKDKASKQKQVIQYNTTELIILLKLIFAKIIFKSSFNYQKIKIT